VSFSQTMVRGWRDWVAFWDEREHPISLSLVRFLLGMCWFYDFFLIWRLDLVIPLFGVGEVGGFSDALVRPNPATWYAWMPGTDLGARALHTLMTLSALSFMLGFFTRTSALLLLVSWSMFVGVLPYADRGIDVLSRLSLCIFVFSSAGAWGSLDAMMRTGSVWGDGRSIGVWARRLLLLQLVWMYTSAGISKVGITWWPMGHYAALYFALQDPAVAAWDFDYLSRQPFFFFTQVGTATTMIYQISYPIVLLLMYWHRNPGVGGRIAAFATRWRLEWIWIGIGGIFHLALAMTMVLGIFPWAMLALYPVWLPPHDLLPLLARARRLLSRFFPAWVAGSET
jgi:hypothetical protein